MFIEGKGFKILFLSGVEGLEAGSLGDCEPLDVGARNQPQALMYSDYRVISPGLYPTPFVFESLATWC